jgi:Tol biopolymer transport system component
MDLLLHREPEPISSVNSEVPVEFEKIVHKALAKRPFQRYQSANEMLLDLRAVRRKLTTDSGYSAPSFELRRRRRKRWIGLSIAALGVVAVAVALKAVLMPASAVPVLHNHRRLTAGAGWEGQPAMSPDGTMVAYTSDAAGNPDIWVLRVDGGDPLRLTRDESVDSDPAWFPDGSAIAFVSDRDGAPAIWQIPPLGGSAVELLDNAMDPAISPDGTRIAFSRTGVDGLERIAVAPLEDIAQVRVLTGDGDGFWGHTDPMWSPDGRTLCYADFKNLWTIDVDGGEARQLTHSDVPDANPIWSPDGKYIFFSSPHEGRWGLWNLRISDGSEYRLTAGTGKENEPSLGPGGRWVVYSTTDDSSDIVVLDLAKGQRSTISGATDEVNPAVSPDGTTIAFVSDRRGDYDLWLQPLLDGRPDGLPRRLTDHRGSVAVPAFSPDGRWLAYTHLLDGQRDVWIVPSGGGVAQRITEHPAADFNPSFSPDGSTLVFCSNRSGVENLWLAPVADGRRVGEPRQLTDSPASHWFPVWSPDGTRIACVVHQGNENEVYVVELASRASEVRVTTGAGAHRALWSPSGEELLVSGSWGSGRISLWIVSLRDSSTRPFDPAVDFGLDEFGAGMYGLDAEGKILAYEVVNRRGDIWHAEADLGRRGVAQWR